MIQRIAGGDTFSSPVVSTKSFNGENERSEESKDDEEKSQRQKEKIKKICTNAKKKNLTDRPEKCTKQHAQTAAKNVKYHSNQAATGLFTAGSAIRSIDHQDVKDIKERGGEE